MGATRAAALQQQCVRRGTTVEQGRLGVDFSAGATDVEYATATGGAGSTDSGGAGITGSGGAASNLWSSCAASGPNTDSSSSFILWSGANATNATNPNAVGNGRRAFGTSGAGSTDSGDMGITGSGGAASNLWSSCAGHGADTDASSSFILWSGANATNAANPYAVGNGRHAFGTTGADANKLCACF